MPNNYQFLDAYSSVLTAHSSVTSGVAQEPYVIISSILSMPALPPSSVSGTVGSSIVGQLPAGTALLGSIAVLQGTSPWATVSSLVNITPSSVLVGASIFGQLPAGTALLGSIATLQGTNPWLIAGTVSILAVSSIGSVAPSMAILIGAKDGSGNLGAISMGNNLGDGGGATAMAIANMVFNGSNWDRQRGNSSIGTLVNTGAGSVITGMRNDTLASILGADLTSRLKATDSAGREITKPFSAEESRVEGYGSIVSTSQMTLVGAAGAGLRNYITDIWLANTGSVATLVTLKDGAGSILGYTIAPSGSGSNLQGLQMPIRTGVNATFDIQPTTGVSILYATVKGFKAP